MHPLDGLQLDHYQIADDQINNLIAQLYTLVGDSNRCLPAMFDPPQAKLMAERLLV